MSHDGSAEVRVARHVFQVRLDDEVLLWNPDCEQLHRLNPSATLVWDALAQWSTAQSVSKVLSESSPLAADVIGQCVDEFRALGLLQLRQPS